MQLKPTLPLFVYFCLCLKIGKISGRIAGPATDHVVNGEEPEDGPSAAQWAASKGDIKKLKEIASEDKNQLFIKDANGWQPIHEAATTGHPTVIELLIEYGADINAETNHGETPLKFAGEEFGNDHPIISVIKENGGELRGNKRSRAQQASADGDIELLKQIASEDVNELFAKDANGWQPIHEAAKAGHPAVVRLLIEHGVDTKAKTNAGETPLQFATSKHGKGHPLVSLLEKHSGEYRNKEPSRAQWAAARGNVTKLKKIASIDANQLFIKDDQGWQPIHEAAAAGHLNAVKLLIEKGANINERTDEGATPLYYAAEEDNHLVVSYLASHGGIKINPMPEL